MSISKLMRMAAAGTSSRQYKIERSLRFNPEDTTFLVRTPTVTGSRTTMTWSAWIKLSRVAEGSDRFIWTSGGTDQASYMAFQWKMFNGQAYVQLEDGANNVLTTSLFRDTAAWYHFLVIFDTTQAIDTEREKIYVNGVEQILTGTYVSQDFELPMNTSGFSNYLGQLSNVGRHFDGYMTEVHFIDGQALTPSDFGEENPITGIWQPKKYIGTYGTNGYYLNFSDNSSTTATTLGKDFSGNGNNLTPNGFSISAGVNNDSVVDTPTPYGVDTGVGGEVRGNYATLNPLVPISGTLTNGNLNYSSNTAYAYANGTIPVPLTGKWIFEATFNSNTSNDNYNVIGLTIPLFIKSGQSFTGNNAGSYGIEDVGPTFGQRFVQDGAAQGSVTVPAGTVIQCLIDRDAGTLTFTKNGSLQTQAGSTVTIPAVELLTVVGSYNVNIDVNFGQRPFAYTAPSGFKSLNTANLPNTPIMNPKEYFNTILYTGDDANTRTITGVGFDPDFTWVKQRNTSRSHILADVVRGSNTILITNQTGAAVSVPNTQFGGIGELLNDGFSLLNGTSNANNVNVANGLFVAWNWKTDGTISINTDGTISSNVSSEPLAGFSIVEHTGNGVDGATVGHGLGSPPDVIITKTTNFSRNWYMWHKNLGSDANGLSLNSTSAEATFTFGNWGTKTSTTMQAVQGTSDIENVNASGNTYISYCFKEVEGYSKFGIYTGNGSNNGAFVYTGFKPAFIMTKNITQASDWLMLDNARDTFNPVSKFLRANLNASEDTTPIVDFTSNGFKLRLTTDPNFSGNNTVYMAFAETPFKNNLAR